MSGSSPPRADNRWSASSALYDPYDSTHNRQPSLPYTDTNPSHPSPEKQTSFYTDPPNPLKGSSPPPFTTPPAFTGPPRPVPIKQGTWTKAVAGGFWPRLIYVFCGVVIFGIWAGVVMNFVRIEKNRIETNAERDMQYYLDAHPGAFDGNPASNWPMLRASLRSFDPDAKTLGTLRLLSTNLPFLIRCYE